MGTGRHNVFVHEQGVGDGSSALRSHAASSCHRLAMYSLRILLATALKVEAIEVKCTGSISTRKVASKYLSNSLGDIMMVHQDVHMKVPRRVVAIEIRQGTSQISRKINFSI